MEPDTWHLYAYCANDPVNFVDPRGHFVWALPALGSITGSSMVMYASTKVGAAMRKAFPKYVSKNKAGSINKVSAKATLKALKLLIGAANLVSKR